MKKVLATAAVSTAILLVGAAAASAAGPVELDGYLRSRGFAERSSAAQDSASSTGYDQKAAIGVKGVLSDNVTGYMRLEVGDGTSDVYGWGQESNQALQTGGFKATNSEFELQQAWIDYKPSWWGIKVGHQPLALGEKLFFDHIASGDDAINLYGDLAGTQFNLIAIKLQENLGNDNSDDLDGYVVNLSRKFGDTFSGNLNYTLLKGGADDDASFPGLDLSNLGVVANLKLAGIDLTVDYEQQFGDVSNTLDAGGNAILVAGSYKLADTTVGLLFGMGSGDDNAADNDMDKFITFLTDKPYQVYIPGYRVAVEGAFGAELGNNGKFTGLSNLTIYQANAKTAMTCPISGKPLSIFGSLSYMQTTEEVPTVGTATEDDLGTEIDLVATWKLTSNLSYQVEAAYLISGDAWNDASNNSDPENLYFLRHGLSLSF